MALLIEKSKGNIQGVLQLVETYPLYRIRDILAYWSEITKPHEERVKDVEAKAALRAEEARLALLEESDKIMVDGQSIDLSKWSLNINPHTEGNILNDD